MSHNIPDLHEELDKILSFWLTNCISKNRDTIIGERSNDGHVNARANMGSMFLGRILYGASAAGKLLQTQKYDVLADTAFRILTQEFTNPKGGYCWAKDSTGAHIHDAENINLAQAFILYGLVEYASYRGSLAAAAAAEKQANFVTQTLFDSANGGYLDDFDLDWKAQTPQTKAFGTHLHLLEAFTKLYQFNKNTALLPLIEDLITTILDKFIDPDSLHVLHRLTPDWHALPNFVWAGHDAECSWILCHSAAVIQHKTLKKRCNTLALKMMDKVRQYAFDPVKGGLFNALQDNAPVETGKIWWPQAEYALGLLNGYKITQAPEYLDLAFNQISYITNTFIDKNGEWYTEINEQGLPRPEIPQIHFWKSLYHHVRYYVEVAPYLKR